MEAGKVQPVGAEELKRETWKVTMSDGSVVAVMNFSARGAQRMAVQIAKNEGRSVDAVSVEVSE